MRHPYKLLFLPYISCYIFNFYALIRIKLNILAFIADSVTIIMNSQTQFTTLEGLSYFDGELFGSEENVIGNPLSHSFYIDEDDDVLVSPFSPEATLEMFRPVYPPLKRAPVYPPLKRAPVYPPLKRAPVAVEVEGQSSMDA
jgi:hypothetical protein